MILTGVILPRAFHICKLTQTLELGTLIKLCTNIHGLKVGNELVDEIVVQSKMLQKSLVIAVFYQTILTGVIICGRQEFMTILLESVPIVRLDVVGFQTL